MSDDNKQLRLSVAVGATGVPETKQEITSLGPVAEQTTQKVNKSLSNLGGGAVEAAQGTVDKVNAVLQKLGAGAQEAFKRSTGFDAAGNKLTESQQRLEAQAKKTDQAIIKQTLAMELAGEGAFALDLALRKLKGNYVESADTQRLIANYQALAAAQAAAASQYTKSGQLTRELTEGTKAYNAALRQVPAQLTDIVVSLQGGQAPLTVLLQQGGQLRDVFGSAGGALKALGREVLGLVNPFTVAAAAIGSIALAYKLGSDETDEFRKAIVLTGNQVGTTTGALADMALNISAVQGTTGAAAAALAQFAASGAVGAAGIQKATEAALALEKFGGQAVAETVKQFKALGDDPLKASIKLNESTNFLTASLYEQIKALESQGRTLEAAKLAQDAFTASSLEKAGEMQANLGNIERLWIGIKDAVKGAGDALLKIGRQEPIAREIAAQQALIASLQRPGATIRRGLDLASPVRESDIADAQARLEVLNKQALKEQEIATSKAAQKLEVDNLVAANKILDQYADKSVKMEKEILDTKQKLKLAGIDNAVIEETIGKIREKYKDKDAKKEDVSESRRSLATYVAELQKRIDKEEKITEVQKANNLLASLGNLGQIKEVRELLLGLAQKADLLEEEGKLLKNNVAQYKDYLAAQDELNAAYVAESKAREQGRLAVDAYVKSIEESNALTQLELSLAGASNVAREIALAQYRIELDLKKQIEAIDKNSGFDEGQREEQRARARAAAAQASLSAVTKANLNEAKRLGDQLENIITDGLMRGFENGKTFAENFRDTLTNVFKTMILRPIVQATVAGGLGAVGINATAAGIGGGAASGAVGGIFAAGTAGAGFTQAFGATVSNGLVSGAAVNAGNISALFSGGQYAAAVGAAAPYVIAAVAASALIKSLIGSGPGPTAYGVATNFDSTGRQVSANSYAGFVARNEQDAINRAIADSFFQLSSKFGAKVDALTIDSQFYDGRSKLGARVNGVEVFANGAGSFDPKDMELQVSRLLLAALQASELPQYLSKAFTGIVASTASAEQIAGAYQFAESLKAVRFGLLSATEQQAEYQKIIDASTVALGTSAATFKQDFIKAIDEGLTPEGLAQWSALGATMQALEQITPKANDALKDLGRTAADIANERKGLQDQLDNLTLSNAQLLQKQRDALDESNRALFDQVQTAQAAKDAADALADAQANLASTNAGLQDRLDLLTGAQTERSLQLRDATDESTRALLRQIFAQEDLKSSAERTAQALQDAANTATTGAQNAFGGLQRAVQAQKDALTTSYNLQRDAISKQLELQRKSYADQIDAAQNASQNIRGISSALSSAVANANRPGASTFGSIQEARRTLTAALSSGGLAGFGGLEDAIKIAGQDSQQFYGTFEEYARDQAASIATLKELDDKAKEQVKSFDDVIKSLKASDDVAKVIADAQLEALEASYKLDMEALDQTLAQGQAQLNALLGIDDSVKSVEAAMSNLGAAISAATAARAAAGGGGAPSSSYTPNSTPFSVEDTPVERAEKVNEYTGFTISGADTGAKLAAKVLYQSINGGASVPYSQYEELSKFGGGSNFSGIGWDGSRESAEQLRKKYSFAVGTNYVPYDMTAQIHEGEAIVPKAFNPAAGGSNNMVEELKAMREEIAAMRVANTAENQAIVLNTLATKKALDRVMPDGDALAVRTAA